MNHFIIFFSFIIFFLNNKDDEYERKSKSYQYDNLC